MICMKTFIQKNWFILTIVGLVVVGFGVVKLASSADPIVAEHADVEVTQDFLPPYGASADDPAEGLSAPVITGEDFDGVIQTTPDSTEGELIFFVAHWCPHCQRELPTVVDWMSSNEIPVNVTIVSTSENVSQGNWPPSSWIEDSGFTGTVIKDSADGEAAGAYGVTSFPFVVAVKDGKVAERHAGAQTAQQYSELAGRISSD